MTSVESAEGYDDLPADSKISHDKIASVLGLDVRTMTEYDVLKAIVDRIESLEKG